MQRDKCQHMSQGPTEGTMSLIQVGAGIKRFKPYGKMGTVERLSQLGKVKPWSFTLRSSEQVWAGSRCFTSQISGAGIWPGTLVKMRHQMLKGTDELRDQPSNSRFLLVQIFADSTDGSSGCSPCTYRWRSTLVSQIPASDWSSSVGGRHWLAAEVEELRCISSITSEHTSLSLSLCRIIKLIYNKKQTSVVWLNLTTLSIYFPLMKWG